MGVWWGGGGGGGGGGVSRRVYRPLINLCPSVNLPCLPGLNYPYSIQPYLSMLMTVKVITEQIMETFWM